MRNDKMTLRRRSSVPLESSDDDDDVYPRSGTTHKREGGSGGFIGGGGAVAVAESKLKKVAVRCAMGAVMVCSFLCIVWAGHLYLSALVVVLQV